MLKSSRAGIAIAVSIFFLISNCISMAHAGVMFHSTSTVSAWQVATNATPGDTTDGVFSSFPTSGFAAAAAITLRPGWIANNDTGNNGIFGDPPWIKFVFRQTFDLTAYDPSTASLSFLWAADDSGQVFARRGSWTPKYRLNGGTLVDGVWPGGESYFFSNTPTTINSGFIAGLNTLDFYVQGNATTDGFALETVSFTASPIASVPEPSSLAIYVFIAACTCLSKVNCKRLRRRMETCDISIEV
jgi:hypothetical protein